ncbi:MAG: sulfur carrier protein ThiS [Kutzneria sp.]|nr:sulfur carrier protein ThiS [Kutzneria sp.]
MFAVVNGTERELPDGVSVAGLLDKLGMTRTGVAVALDGAVVPRGNWTTTTLRSGSVVEVLTAVGGG